MTKTLTEQWREGTLPDGYYYIDYDTQQRIFEIEDGCATYQGLPAETYFLNDVCLIKVLAPVPSYEEYNLLKKKAERADYLDEKLKYFTPEESYFVQRAEKKLAIATKALKEYANCKPTEWMSCVTADEALKEMEGVK